MITYAVGDELAFAEDPNPFTIQAVSMSGRWVACTRGWTEWDNEQARLSEADTEYFDSSGWPELGECVYTVLDLERGLRGPDNAVGSLGYETREDCERSIALFESGEFEHSRRSRPIPLQLARSTS